MKTIFATLFAVSLLTLTAGLAGCSTTGGAATAEAAPLDPKDADAEVAVKGMSCPQCANNLKLIMEKMEPIQQARVDLGEGRVLLAFNPGQTASEADIALAVKDAGFTPGAVTYKAKAGE